MCGAKTAPPVPCSKTAPHFLHLRRTTRFAPADTQSVNNYSWFKAFQTAIYQEKETVSNWSPPAWKKRRGKGLSCELESIRKMGKATAQAIEYVHLSPQVLQLSRKSPLRWLHTIEIELDNMTIPVVVFCCVKKMCDVCGWGN